MIQNQLRVSIKREQVILIAIILLASFFRLYNISGYMTFLGDEGRDALVVKRMIVDGKLTLLGPTASVGGFFLGPIYYYFMIPFLWLWKMDPVGPAIMVALFGIATVYLVYRFGKELFGEYPALLAALLYALSPVVIAYSRSSWNPNLVPFFSTLLLYLLYRAVSRKQWRLIFPIGIIIGIGLQLHYLFLFLIVLTVAWFILWGRKTSLLRFYGIGLVGFVVGYGPFLLFELRHGFPNTHAITQFLLTGNETGFSLLTFLSNIRDVSYRLFARLVLRHPQPEIWISVPHWQQALWNISARLILALSIVNLFLTMRNRNSRDRSVGSSLLFLWLITTIFLFGFYKRGIYDYYFGIAFALPFLLTGFIFSKFWVQSVGRVVAVVSAIALLILNWQGRPFQFAPNNQLEQVRKISALALTKAEGKPFNFALIAPFNSDHAYRYFFEIWNHKPVTIENLEKDPERKSVTDQLIIICEDPSCKPLGHPLWEIAGFGRAEVDGLWDGPFVRIYRLVHYDETKKD